MIYKVVYYEKSEKVKHVSVAQLVHEISLKAFKIDFFNFHDFVNFLSSKYFAKKTCFQGFFP